MSCEYAQTQDALRTVQSSICTPSTASDKMLPTVNIYHVVCLYIPYFWNNFHILKFLNQCNNLCLVIIPSPKTGCNILQIHLYFFSNWTEHSILTLCSNNLSPMSLIKNKSTVPKTLNARIKQSEP